MKLNPFMCMYTINGNVEEQLDRKENLQVGSLQLDQFMHDNNVKIVKQKINTEGIFMRRNNEKREKIIKVKKISKIN